MNRLRSCWERHFLPAELGVAVAATLVFVAWATFFGGQIQIQELLEGNRTDVYGALASVSGALLGFTITAISIALGYAQSDRLAIVRESPHYPTLWAVFASANRALAMATVFSLVGLAIDRDIAPTPGIQYITVFAVLLSSLRLGRCIWVLDNVVGLVTAESKARPAGDKQ